MVMLTRGRQRIVALLTLLGAFLRTLSGFSIPEADHDDESEQGEVAESVHAVGVEQAPAAGPSMPLGLRFVSARPQEEELYQHPSWLRAGSSSMLVHRAGASTLARRAVPPDGFTVALRRSL